MRAHTKQVASKRAKGSPKTPLAAKGHAARTTLAHIDASIAWTEQTTCVDVSDHTAGFRAPLGTCEVRARILPETLPDTVQLEVSFPFCLAHGDGGTGDPIHIFLENLPVGAIPMLAAGLNSLYEQMQGSAGRSVSRSVSHCGCIAP